MVKDGVEVIIVDINRSGMTLSGKRILVCDVD